MAKFRRTMEANRSETIAFHEARKREKQEIAERAERIRAERAERDEKQKEEAKAEQAARSASVEAECMAYGYGRGNHYSAFSGWGNYCGD